MKYANIAHTIQSRWRSWVLVSGVVALVLVLSGTGFFGWRFWQEGASVALHYSVLLGVDSIGPWWYILLLPGVGALAWIGLYLLHASVPERELLHDMVLVGAWMVNVLLILGMLFAFVASAS